MDIVETCVESAPAHLKSYMRTMAGLDNIPRKEKQFRNFTANSLNLRGKNESIVGEIWNVLKTEREKRQTEKEVQQQQQHKPEKQPTEEQEKSDNENHYTETTTKLQEEQNEKPNKSPNGKDVQAANSANENDIDSTTVEKAMKKALKKAPNQSMKLKELRKLIGEKLGLPKSSMKRLKKLLETAPEACNKTKVKVDGKMITLI